MFRRNSMRIVDICLDVSVWLRKFHSIPRGFAQKSGESNLLPIAVVFQLSTTIAGYPCLPALCALPLELWFNRLQTRGKRQS